MVPDREHKVGPVLSLKTSQRRPHNFPQLPSAFFIEVDKFLLQPLNLPVYILSLAELEKQMVTIKINAFL